MKLYWRVKIDNKWTYQAAETYQRQFNKGEFTICVKELDL
jgi:hypothetical protein